MLSDLEMLSDVEIRKCPFARERGRFTPRLAAGMMLAPFCNPAGIFDAGIFHVPRRPS